MSALLTGVGSTNAFLKSGPIAAMKLRVSARLKSAVHALAGLQTGVGDLYRAHQGAELAAFGSERTKADHNVGLRHARRADQVHGAHRQRAGKVPWLPLLSSSSLTNSAPT